MNGFYDGISLQERTVVLPDIKRGATLYWIATGELMPVAYHGVSHGIVEQHGENKGNFRVLCRIKTKREQTFKYKRKRKVITIICEKGRELLFCPDDIGKTIFTTRSDAEIALRNL